MKRFRVRLLLATSIAALALAVPTAANASIFGDLLTGTLSSFGNDYTLVQVRNTDGSEFAGAPSAGVITSVRVQAFGPAGSVDAVFLRPVSPLGDGMNFTKIGPNLTIPLAEFLTAGGRPVDTPTRVSVAAGDRVALSVPTGIGVFMSYSEALSPDLCGYVYALDSQAVGAPQTFNVAGCNKNLPAVQATLEPDADGDGYGDLSQDSCPTDGGRITACFVPPSPAHITVTAVKSSSKAASNASRSFVVANTGQTAASVVPFTIKSSKSVKNLKIVKGCTPDSTKRKCVIPVVGAGSSVTIKVSLSFKKAKSTTLTGSSGAASATSTVKLKAKKK